MSADAIPGRYRWMEREEDLGIITLLTNHTFIHMKGASSPNYQWRLDQSSLTLTFNSATIRFVTVEKQGPHLTFRSDQDVRMSRED